MLAGLVLLLAFAAAARATPAEAQAFGVTDFTAGVLTDPDNDSSYFQTAAGRPPFGVTDFTFATDADGEPVGNAKNLRIDIPRGLTPNFPAIPTCTDAQLTAQKCPPESQIGVQRLRARGSIGLLKILGLPTRQTLDVRVPLFNLTRGADQVARFGFNPAQAPGSNLLGDDGSARPVDLSPVTIIGGVRPSDNGLYFTISNVPLNPAMVRSDLVFWGVPGAAGHDAERTQARTDIPGLDGTLAAFAAHQTSGGNVAVADKATAFLTNPTSCSGQQTSTVAAESYDGETASRSYTTPVGIEGCDQVPFQPTLTFSSDAPVTRDAPAALKVAIGVPQSQDAGTRGSAHLKDAKVTLPSGFTINPSAAAGLDTCSDAQLGQGTADPVACPDAAKVGTVSITSPVLEGPLTGSIYVGTPLPGDRYRLFLVADGRGVTIRLKGDVTPDPTSGQLTATFADNPELPFTSLNLAFAGGDRGIIASPQTCGSATGSAALTPYSSASPVTVGAAIDVTGCDGFPFEPTFSAETASPQSGKSSPLVVSFNRPDGNQFLSGITAALPPGLTANIKGVPQCAEAQIAAQACPAASQIGVASVQAGAGGSPYPLTGAVYLTGGYNGGALGMVTIVHALAGPYDLGNVVVRQSLRIDASTAQITVVSDPLPQIQEGVALRLRSLRLDLNHKEFIRNPTSCGPKTVGATLSSPGGATVQRSAGLTFTGCQSLRFAPKITVALKNRSQMGSRKHPRVTATVTQRGGEAGIRSTQVALPTRVALAAANAQALCEPTAAAKGACPKASIVGSATAVSTVLNRRLFGPVYFVRGERTTASGKKAATLPTLYIPLRGEVAIDLQAVTSVSHNRLVTTLPAIPDQPITTFTLNIDGGKHGIIAATRNLCAGKSVRATGRFVGYNGRKGPTRRPKVGTACKKAKKAPKKQQASPKKAATPADAGKDGTGAADASTPDASR